VSDQLQLAEKWNSFGVCGLVLLFKHFIAMWPQHLFFLKELLKKSSPHALWVSGSACQHVVLLCYVLL